MALTEPKRKKYCKLRKQPSLPVLFKKDGSIIKFEATFNGFSVILDDPSSMKNIVSMGYFGKANFSRSYPQNVTSKTEIIRKRQFEYRKKLSNKYGDKKNIKKIIVVPDSEEEGDYFTNLKPEYQIDGSNLKEEVWLSLEESFFLHYAVKCLDIKYENKTLQTEDIWTIFSETEPLFTRNYVVYFYYRSKNWVVKPGIKFGGDYLLYKEGPAFYHASYVVIIDVINDKNDRVVNLMKTTLDNVGLLRLNRLCETAGKELIVCKLKILSGFTISYKNLKVIEIEEMIVKRWISTQERNQDD